MKASSQPRIPKPLSRGEEEFALQCQVKGLVPMREARFHVARRWRFDFAFPDRLLAIEIEGATWQRGRHNRGSGFEADCEKYNAATILGWKVLRYSTDMVILGDAIRDVEEMLK